MRLTIEDVVLSVNVRGDELEQGHVYRDDCDDLVIATDEGTVLDLSTGVIHPYGDDAMFTPVKAHLKVEA